MSRRALITGITGQDGSYLADLLLEKGYEVHGMVRRSSTETFQRLEHIRDDIVLHTGDLLDQSSLTDVLRACEPDEIYNLAAMSFVAASWNQPVLTSEFTGVGVTRLLEAMRETVPEARFYQASSSEMFGKVRELPQNERTPFYPRSPYGVAKVYGHFITVNYRESYGLYACSGILFNHECMAAATPVVVRRRGTIAVKAVEDLMPLVRKGRSTQSFTPDDLTEVWDGREWTVVRAITATRRRATDPDHAMRRVEARGGIVDVTSHHRMLDPDNAVVPARDVEAGDSLALADEMGETPAWTALDPKLAELLGLLAADGFVSPDGRSVRFTNNDGALRARAATLWNQAFLGSSSDVEGPSGFAPEHTVMRVELAGARAVGPWLRAQLYTRSGHKQVPELVLNGGADVQDAFLAGYYAGDGLKRGNGASVETNSAVLAQGVYWLYASRGQRASVHAEERAGRVYYQLDLPSVVRVGAKGQHLRKDPSEVRRVSAGGDSEWVFDLETESGVLCAGVGGLVVHNSERRGLEFVTRKVTHGAAAIKLGRADELALGNLDAMRDWGYAKDYVEAMWLMLQQDEPDDFVIATGKTHTVRELVDIAFTHVDLDPAQYVRQDARFLRPAEVDHLVGDYSKARDKLGWEPRTSFEDLIRLMVEHDLELLARGVPQKQSG